MKGGRIDRQAFAGGRYALARLVGEGSRKQVFLARDTRLGRDVAVGVLKTEALDDTDRSRLIHEARAMARLGDHPRIVSIFDVGEEEGRPYIVCQYVAGGTLAARLAAGPPLPVAEILRITDQVCQALEHAHARDVVHRDVKPANVWLTDDGFAKLGDFGLAASPDRVRPSEGALLGTARYLAPEQALGKPAEARSDLYSLGCTLYEMVTGRPPFTGDTLSVIAQHVHAPPPPPSTHVTLPQALERLILRLLAKEPGERPVSARAVREELRQIPGDASPSIEPATGAPFVGRSEELERIRGALDEALAGRGRLVLVGGEPGIGKTRLAERSCAFARARGAWTLVGRCHEGTGTAPFWPWVQIFRAATRSREAALTAMMASHAGDVAPIIHGLGRGPPDVTAASPVDPFRLFDSITALLARLADVRPLVILLDDLQWADPSSIALLQFVARQIADLRILVLATHRDVRSDAHPALVEALPALRREAGPGRIRLRGLPAQEVFVLLEALAGMRLPDHLARTIAADGEGNPFFVQEILRNLVDDGVLHHEAGRWKSRWRSGDPLLPESARDVVEQRLSRLSPSCRHVLELAAVVGREVDVDLLEELEPLSPDEIADELAEASAAGVVRATSPGRFAFVHALTRETLRLGIAPRRRAALHRRIADALSSSAELDDDERRALRAHHALEAASRGEELERAVADVVNAAERASACAAHDDAVRLYERALAVIPTRRASDPVRLRILLDLGTALSRADDAGRAREVFEEAAGVARRSGDPRALARVLAASRPAMTSTPQKADGETAAVAASPPAPVESSSRDLFRREGDYWTIAYRGRTFRLRDAKGLRYIAALIAATGREVHALELAGASPSARQACAQLGDAGPILDPRAKEQYARRLAEAREELDEALAFNDAGRAARARREIEMLTRELTAAVGIGGRDRRAVSPAERARLSVFSAIRAALAKIADNDAELGRHFSRAIRTGTFCSYEPGAGQAVDWSL